MGCTRMTSEIQIVTCMQNACTSYISQKYFEVD